MARPVFIVDGSRTPFLKARSGPGPFTPVDLAVQCGRPLLARQPFSPDDFDQVILGCVNVIADEMNPARVAALRLGMLVADSTKLRRSAPVRIAHMTQIQTFVTDQELPERLATICHSKGIEVVEAMPKGADIDDTQADAQDAAPEAAPVVRLR